VGTLPPVRLQGWCARERGASKHTAAVVLPLPYQAAQWPTGGGAGLRGARSIELNGASAGGPRSRPERGDRPRPQWCLPHPRSRASHPVDAAGGPYARLMRAGPRCSGRRGPSGGEGGCGRAAPSGARSGTRGPGGPLLVLLVAVAAGCGAGRRRGARADQPALPALPAGSPMPRLLGLGSRNRDDRLLRALPVPTSWLTLGKNLLRSGLSA